MENEGTQRSMASGANSQDSKDFSLDRALARRVAGGSLEAWHRLILDHAGLMEAQARKVLKDEDDTRLVVVRVLARLWSGGITRYQGRCPLGAWLVLITRNEAIDLLRERLGRKTVPGAISEMSGEDQIVFRQYYLEGRPGPEVRQLAASNGTPISHERFLASLSRIESALESRTLRRLEYERAATESGGVPARMQRLLNELQAEQERRRHQARPDTLLQSRDVENQILEILDVVEQLPEEEREAIRLRYQKEMSANEMASALGMDNRRQAYTLLEKAIRHLRRLIGVP